MVFLAKLCWNRHNIGHILGFLWHLVVSRSAVEKTSKGMAFLVGFQLFGIFFNGFLVKLIQNSQSLLFFSLCLTPSLYIPFSISLFSHDSLYVPSVFLFFATLLPCFITDSLSMNMVLCSMSVHEYMSIVSECVFVL